MTRAEIDAFFPAPGERAKFGALLYAVPTVAWLRGPFWDFFRQRYWSNDLGTWQFRWECRDFARAYACTAQECWARTQGDKLTDVDGLAVGEIWFIPDALKPQEGHAICPALTDKGRVFIDPQNNELWEITPVQLLSRYFLRF